MASIGWRVVRDGLRRAGRSVRDALQRGPGSPGPHAGQARGNGTWREEHHRGPHGKRPYAVYTPPGVRPGAPLLVLLHGCTQDPLDMAVGTGMNRLADREGFVIAYPQQVRRHNARCCWNWFRPEDQRRDGGEPAELAAITDDVATAAAVDRDRVYVAGMSAGGAMATVLAATHPDVYAAVGVHSGMAYAAASDARSAFAAMRSADGGAPVDEAHAAVTAMGEHARIVPAIVVHGAADDTVDPTNGERIVRQWLLIDQLVSSGHWSSHFDAPDDLRTVKADGRRSAVVARWRRRRDVIAEYWHVDGLGHAWSGGVPGGSYTDPRGPDAALAMWRFFRRHHR